MPPPLILSDLAYFMTDFRVKPLQTPNGRRTRGTVFICGFAYGTDGHILMGMEGKLWRAEPEANAGDESWPRTRHNRHKTWAWLCRRASTMCAQMYRFPHGSSLFNLPEDCLPTCTLFNVVANKRCWGQKRSWHPLHQGKLINLNHLLIRLQRWTRRVVLGRPRVMALAMALHARLGAGSVLATLGEDVLSLLIRDVRALRV